MPGELKNGPRAILAFTETGTGFDQSYRVDCVRRTIDERGFNQVIRARSSGSRTVVPGLVTV
jgi:hypothetical protein